MTVFSVVFSILAAFSLHSIMLYAETIDQLRKRLGFTPWGWEAVHPEKPGKGVFIKIVDNFCDIKIQETGSDHGSLVGSVLRGLVPAADVAYEDVLNLSAAGRGGVAKRNWDVINISVMYNNISDRNQDLYVWIENAVKEGSVVVIAAGNESEFLGANVSTYLLADLAQGLNRNPRVKGAIIFVGSGSYYNGLQTDVVPTGYSNMAGIVPNYFVTVPYEAMTLHSFGIATYQDAHHIEAKSFRKAVGNPHFSFDSGRFLSIGGTSFAAPVVSAALVLLKQKARQNGRELTGKELVYTLLHGPFPDKSYPAEDFLQFYAFPNLLSNKQIPASLLVGHVFDLRTAIARIGEKAFLDSMDGPHPPLNRYKKSDLLYPFQNIQSDVDLGEKLIKYLAPASAKANLFNYPLWELSQQSDAHTTTDALRYIHQLWSVYGKINTWDALYYIYFLYAAVRDPNCNKLDDTNYLHAIGLSTEELDIHLLQAMEQYDTSREEGTSLEEAVQLMNQSIERQEKFAVDQETRKRVSELIGIIRTKKETKEE